MDDFASVDTKAADIIDQSPSVHSDAGTGIRTGEQYLAGLRDDRVVWTKGHRVADVTAEPGMMRGAATLASFLDRQHNEEYRDTVTYIDDDGDRCAMAFKKPKSQQDILDRGCAYT